jgi:hypothetical protein
VGEIDMPNVQFTNQTTKIEDVIVEVQSHRKKYDDKIAMLFKVNLDAINQFLVKPQNCYVISNQISARIQQDLLVVEEKVFNYEIRSHPEAPNFISRILEIYSKWKEHLEARASNKGSVED